MHNEKAFIYMESKSLHLYRIKKLTSTWNQKDYIYME